jgi:GNAT superfamily N-acetyltransferase
LSLLIRKLDPKADLDAVQTLYDQAADYWLLSDHRAPDRQKACDFFTDTPPNCDPAASHRLGIFLDTTLLGVTELSFGFPEPDDAYLGLMILAPQARSQGLGRVLLAEVERRARPAPQLYLAVLDANPRGGAFWAAQGFRPTGITRTDPDTGHLLHRLVKQL